MRQDGTVKARLYCSCAEGLLLCD